jgi:hypothetical protein
MAEAWQVVTEVSDHLLAQRMLDRIRLAADTRTGRSSVGLIPMIVQARLRCARGQEF